MYNANRNRPEYVYSVSLATGIAAREFTFQSPNFTCKISHLDVAADAADSTDKPTWSVKTTAPSGSEVTKLTSAVVTSADTITRTTAMDSGQDDIVAANSRVKLVLATAGTAGNVLGLTARLVLVGSN